MNRDSLRESDETERLIARAVRSMPLPALPTDFAAQVTAQVDAERPRLTWDLILSCLLLLSLGVVGLVYSAGTLDAGPLAGKPTLTIALVGLCFLIQLMDVSTRINGIRTHADHGSAR